MISFCTVVPIQEEWIGRSFPALLSGNELSRIVIKRTHLIHPAVQGVGAEDREKPVISNGHRIAIIFQIQRTLLAYGTNA